MPYDENGEWYDTYGGQDTPPDPTYGATPVSPAGQYSTTAANAAATYQNQRNAYLQTLYSRGSGTTARSPSTSMPTAQAAYGAATGGAYDPATTLTAYQQAQLGLSQQELQLQQQQYMMQQQNAANQLGFNYAQLGQQGSQFQQNYGLDLAQYLSQSQGTPYQWAGLAANTNLQQQQIDLSARSQDLDTMLGIGNLALASEAHDLQMMLGLGNLQQGQAETYATLTRLGIDVYQSDLNAQIARERMALDQQVEAARAGALSAQAAAEATRAAAAMRAVEVQLQLGNGDLALGHEKLAQAERMGLADINLRQQELGLKDKIATNDQQLQAFLGITGQQTQRDIASLQAQVQREGLGSQEKIAAWNVMQNLRGPRDWAQAVNVRHAMGDNPFAALGPGAAPLAGDVGGPAEPISWNTFLQDNGLPNYAQPGTGGGGGFNFNNTPWQQMVAGFQGGGGGFQAPTTNASWMGQVPGGAGGSSGQWAPTPGFDPINNFNSPRFNERAPWADAVLSGQMSPAQAWQLLPKATVDQWNRMSDADKNSRPWMNPYTNPNDIRSIEQLGGIGIPMGEAQQAAAYQNALAGGATPEEAATQANLDAAAFQRMNADYQARANAGEIDFTPVQGMSLGEAWANPATSWMFNISPELAQRAQQDRRVMAANGTAAPEPIINGDGSVMMPNGAYIPPQGGQPQAPAQTTTAGSFQAPTTTGVPVGAGGPLTQQMGFTGNFMGIPIPQMPQTPVPQMPAGIGGNSLVNQMIQQYMMNYPTQQAQQSPSGQNALTLVLQMMDRAQQQQPSLPAVPASTPTTGAAQAPIPQIPQPSYPTIPTMPSFNNPAQQEFLPVWTPNSPYYPQSTGSPVYGQPDSPGVYRTGANATDYNRVIQPTEAGGATPVTGYFGITGGRSPYDSPTMPGLTTTSGGSATRLPSSATDPQTYLNAITGGPIQHTTNPLATGQRADTPQAALGTPQYSNAASTTPYVYGQHAGYNSDTSSGGYVSGTNWGSYGSDSYPQYATGTAYVPETGPAIVHQGEAIVPAAQNPANPANQSTYYPWGFSGPAVTGSSMTDVLARTKGMTASQWQAQPSGFAAPSSTSAQVQQAAPPSSPTDLNSLTNPQAPQQPAQQQMAASQLPQNPMAPQPVANEPSYAQPISPPNTTVQTAGLGSPTPMMQGIYDSLRAAGSTLGPIGNYTYDALLSLWNNRPQAQPQPAAAPAQPTGGYQSPPAAAPTYQQFIAPTPGFAAPSTNPAITALMAQIPAPQQVSYRVWANDLSPSEREMALGEWERQGHYVPDVLDLIEKNRLTVQQGAYAGGYAGIGR